MIDNPAQTAIVNTDAGFLALRDDWNALWECAGDRHFFQSFNWCWHVWKEIASVRGRSLRLVTVRHDGQLVLVWPLMIAGRQMRLLASDTLEYRDFIVKPGPLARAWAEAAWAAACDTPKADTFWFQNLRAPSNLAGFIADKPCATPVGGGWCPIIRLDRYSSWKDYTQRLPKSLVSDQRRQWKRAIEVLPRLSFTIVDNPAEIESTLAWILDHKVRWLQNRGKNAAATLFSSAEMRAFFDSLLKTSHSDGQLVLARLSDGTTTISAGFGYRFGNDFLFHVFVYDAAWNRLSPSRLFLESLIQWCIGKGIKTFDFMPGTEAYKYTWADDLVQTDSYYGALTRPGALLMRWHLLRQKKRRIPAGLRAIYGHLPDHLRHIIGSTLINVGLIQADIERRPEKPALLKSGG